MLSAISIALGGWVVLNGVLFAALMLRRDRPEARKRLFQWVLKGERRRRRKVQATLPGHQLSKVPN
jgi:hypothetical protein